MPMDFGDDSVSSALSFAQAFSLQRLNDAGLAGRCPKVFRDLYDGVPAAAALLKILEVWH
jgi:hypothetical protein